MSHPANQISQPNQTIALAPLEEIENHLISSSDPEKKKVLELLKVIIDETDKMASSNYKHTHKSLNAKDFADLKKINIYLQKIENYENHEKLIKRLSPSQSQSLKKLARLLKINNFINPSYSYHILTALTDKASFSAFSHLDTLLNEFSDLSDKGSYISYIIKKIDDETYNTWRRAFSVEMLAPLFNMSGCTLYSLQKSHTIYKKKNPLPNIEPSDEIKNPIKSSLDQEQKELLKVIIDEIDKMASSNYSHTHKSLNAKDFADLKIINIYLQKIENYENHKKLIKRLSPSQSQSQSLKKLARLLKINNFINPSYSYHILTALTDKASFSAFSRLDTLLNEFSDLSDKGSYISYIIKKIDPETYKTWHRTFSRVDLAPLFNMSAPTLSKLQIFNSTYNSDPIKENPLYNIEPIDEIERLITLSLEPEQKKVLELLKVIILEIENEASKNSKNTHRKYLPDHEFSDLKNLNIYLLKIKSFQNHENLQKILSLSLEKLARFLKIKNFTNLSYSKKILEALIDPDSFSAFAHLDTILKEFSQTLGRGQALKSKQTIMNSRIFDQWKKALSIEQLAALLNMSRNAFYKFQEKLSSQQALTKESSNEISTQLLLQYGFLKESAAEWLDNISDPSLNLLADLNPDSDLKNEAQQVNPYPISAFSIFSSDKDNFLSKENNESFLNETISLGVFNLSSKDYMSLNKKRSCLQVEGFEEELDAEFENFLNSKYP